MMNFWKAFTGNLKLNAMESMFNTPGDLTWDTNWHFFGFSSNRSSCHHFQLCFFSSCCIWMPKRTIKVLLSTVPTHLHSVWEKKNATTNTVTIEIEDKSLIPLRRFTPQWIWSIALFFSFFHHVYFLWFHNSPWRHSERCGLYCATVNQQILFRCGLFL